MSFQRGEALVVLTKLDGQQSTEIRVQTTWNAGRTICDALMPQSSRSNATRTRRSQLSVGPQTNMSQHRPRQSCDPAVPPSSRSNCGMLVCLFV